MQTVVVHNRIAYCKLCILAGYFPKTVPKPLTTATGFVSIIELERCLCRDLFVEFVVLCFQLPLLLGSLMFYSAVQRMRCDLPPCKASRLAPTLWDPTTLYACRQSGRCTRNVAAEEPELQEVFADIRSQLHVPSSHLQPTMGSLMPPRALCRFSDAFRSTGRLQKNGRKEVRRCLLTAWREHARAINQNKQRMGEGYLAPH